MGWNPIESAPMDGTFVLLFCPGNAESIPILAQFIEFEGDEDGGEWYEHGAGPCLDVEPTHWFPLPELPEFS